MNKDLFDGDSSDDDIKLETNKEYAKSYNSMRQKELLKKCMYSTIFTSYFIFNQLNSF